MIFPYGEIAASLRSSQRQDQLASRCHCERSEAISSCVFTLKPGLVPAVTPVFLFNIFESSLNSINSLYSCSKIRSPPAHLLWMSVARPSMAFADETGCYVIPGASGIRYITYRQARPAPSPVLLFNPVGIYLDLRQMSQAPAMMPTRLGIHAASMAGIAPPCPSAVVIVMIV